MRHARLDKPRQSHAMARTRTPGSVTVAGQGRIARQPGALQAASGSHRDGVLIGLVSGFLWWNSGRGDDAYQRCVHRLSGPRTGPWPFRWRWARTDQCHDCLVAVWWPSYARLIRVQALALRDREYILAAHALGGGSGWVIFRHILPNSLVPLIVLLSTDAAPAW